VAPRLQAQLSDAEVDDVGPLSPQCAVDEPCAADDEEASVGRAVVDQRRPRLAASVCRGTYRLAVVSDDEGYVERSQGYWFTRGGDDELVLWQSRPATQLGRRRAADDLRARALGHDRRIHRVVEVGVDGQDGL
jgi:hypothetical protein